MKTKLLFLLFFVQLSIVNGQSIQINQIMTTPVNDGINVNLLVTSSSGAGYLSHSYTVVGNTINLDVCYWFNSLSVISQISKDFLITVPNDINYVINISTFNSSSSTVCDYFSVGPTASINYLETENYELQNSKYSIYPNPSKGIIELKGVDSLVKQIKIYDNLGRLIKLFNGDGISNIDLFELNDGIYYVYVETETGNWKKKLIIKK
jgi:hypothetical protein